MFRSLIGLTFLFLMEVGITYGVPTTSSPTNRINNLIEQLSSEDSAVRENAIYDLETIGEPALEALKKATKGENKEVAALAERLIRKMESRVANKKRFDATVVELKLKDATIDSAIKEFNKQSGYTILFRGNHALLKEKRITLETGKVPFWTAYEKLVEVAELQEVDPQTNPSPFAPLPINKQPPVVPPAPMEKENKAPKKEEKSKEDKKKEGNQKEEKSIEELLTPPREVTEKTKIANNPAEKGNEAPKGFGPLPQAQKFKEPRLPSGPIIPVGTLYLEEGKRNPCPSHVEGAIRIRALPHLSPADSGQNIPKEEMAFFLQANAEPKIHIMRTIGVKIEKAMDNNDQKLSFVTAVGNSQVPQKLNALADSFGRSNFTAISEVPFSMHFKKGEKETKLIKELVGVVTIVTQFPPEELVVINDVLKAKPETVKGHANSSLKVVEINKQEDGSYLLTVELAHPTSTVRPKGQLLRQEVGFKFGFLNNNLGIELQDTKGKNYQCDTVDQLGNSQLVDGIIYRNLILKYKPINKEQGEPSKVLFRGTQSMELNVPFTLKNVVLSK